MKYIARINAGHGDEYIEVEVLNFVEAGIKAHKECIRVALEEAEASVICYSTGALRKEYDVNREIK